MNREDVVRSILEKVPCRGTFPIKVVIERDNDAVASYRISVCSPSDKIWENTVVVVLGANFSLGDMNTLTHDFIEIMNLKAV